MSKRHDFKIATPTGWQRQATPEEWREARAKELVEHDEWCWCNDGDDSEPPF